MVMEYALLALDLNGDGVRTISVDQGILFDMQADGVKNATGWLDASDGFLARDLNHDGVINTGKELFGNNTVLANGNTAADGYQALSQLDSNHDGVINSSDSSYSELLVWQDLNQNGISDANELKTLEQIGIASIAVNPTSTRNVAMGNNNTIGAESVFTWANGSSGQSASLNLAENVFVRQFTTPVDTSLVANLADMQGTGSVRDLKEAAALSPELAALLVDVNYSTDFEVVISKWAATSDMATLASTLVSGSHPRGGRGTNLTTEEIRRLGVLEKFTGLYGAIYDFVDPMWKDNPGGPTANKRYNGTYYGINLDAAAINQKYEILLNTVSSNVSLQTYLASSNNLVDYLVDNSGVRLDLSRLYQAVSADPSITNLQNLLMLHSYYNALGDNVYTQHEQGSELLTTEIVNKLTTADATNIDYIATATAEMINRLNQQKVISLDQVISMIGVFCDVMSEYDLSAVDYIKSANDVIVSADKIVNSKYMTKTIITGNSDNIITATYGNYTIYANGGNDTLETSGIGELSNTLVGGTGDDTLLGGESRDSYVYNLGDGADQITDIGGTDKIVFGAGISLDSIEFITEGNDMILNILGSEVGSIRIKNIFSGAQYYIETLELADGTQYDLAETYGLRYGNDQDNIIYGLGKQTVALLGKGGNDQLYASVNGDTLVGGTGNDILTGSTGSDTYIYNVGDGADTVIDASVNNKIVFGAGISLDNIQFTVDGNDMILSLLSSAGDSIRIKDIFAANRSAEYQLVLSDGSVYKLTDIYGLRSGNDQDNLIRGLDNYSVSLFGRGG